MELQLQPLSLGLSGLFSSLASHPSTSDNNVQFVTECVHSMLLVRHTSNKFWNLDYDKIPIHYVPFTPTLFNGDVTFELPPFLANIHNSSHMQSVDRKYNGHVWCKVIITNIKNSFGLNFRKVCCLGHLLCVQNDRENFVLLGFHNEIF
jgi:hypothetical protein